jgi:hypothetical protein
MADRAEPELPQGQAECLMASTPPDTHSRSNPEVSAPMLDVHAPHQAIRTWNEFLVHIAGKCDDYRLTCRRRCDHKEHIQPSRPPRGHVNQRQFARVGTDV